jgi:hypothetical protein
MKRWINASLLALGLVAALAPGRAAAQSAFAPGTFGRPVPNPFGTPAVSPYVNLNRGGSPGINYYGLVRPELQTQQSLMQLQQGQVLLQQSQAAFQTGLAGGTPLLTGHEVQFQNYMQFFPATLGGVQVRR